MLSMKQRSALRQAWPLQPLASLRRSSSSSSSLHSQEISSVSPLSHRVICSGRPVRRCLYSGNNRRRPRRRSALSCVPSSEAHPPRLPRSLASAASAQLVRLGSSVRRSPNRWALLPPSSHRPPLVQQHLHSAPRLLLSPLSNQRHSLRSVRRRHKIRC